MPIFIVGSGVGGYRSGWMWCRRHTHGRIDIFCKHDAFHV